MFIYQWLGTQRTPTAVVAMDSDQFLNVFYILIRNGCALGPKAGRTMRTDGHGVSDFSQISHKHIPHDPWLGPWMELSRTYVRIFYLVQRQNTPRIGKRGPEQSKQGERIRKCDSTWREMVIGGDAQTSGCEGFCCIFSYPPIAHKTKGIHP